MLAQATRLRPELPVRRPTSWLVGAQARWHPYLSDWDGVFRIGQMPHGGTARHVESSLSAMPRGHAGSSMRPSNSRSRSTARMIRRLSSLAVALWFALYVGAPQLLHPCPQHAVPGAWGHGRAMAAHHVGASAAASATMPMGGTESSAAHDHGATPSSGDTSAPTGKHNCCCPGPQCGSVGVPVAIRTSWIEVTLVEATVAARGAADPPRVVAGRLHPPLRHRTTRRRAGLTRPAR